MDHINIMEIKVRILYMLVEFSVFKQPSKTKYYK